MALPRTPLGATGLTVSRLGLGTAEIGFAYGIGPKELPSESAAIGLLKASHELGITFFDTARYYGEAEARIRASGILNDDTVVVETKCAQFLEKGEIPEGEALADRIRLEVAQSCEALGVSTLPLLLLHGPSAELLLHGSLVRVIEKLKEEGVIRHWGVSTRGVEAPLAAMEQGAEVIQIAFNIADKRMQPVLQAARERKVGVVCRSAYLKGVFAGRAEHLPSELAPLREIVDAATRVATELNISLPELALRYVLSEEAISTVLIGTAKSEHVASAVTAFEKGPLPVEVIEALRSHASEDAAQVDPARWPPL